MKNLSDLFLKYPKSDKLRRHNYVLIYEMLFKQYETQKQGNLLEIGVQNGHSLRIWNEWLPNFNIYGIDIEQKFMFQTDKIKTFCVNSTKESEIKENLGNLKFDIILDDGDHSLKSQILTFKNLIRYLNPNGIYCIEDLENGLTKEFLEIGDDPLLNLNSFMYFNTNLNKKVCSNSHIVCYKK